MCQRQEHVRGATQERGIPNQSRGSGSRPKVFKCGKPIDCQIASGENQIRGGLDDGWVTE